MINTALSTVFLAFATDRNDRARDLHSLAEEARRVSSCFALFVSLRSFALQTLAARRATLQAGENPFAVATLEGGTFGARSHEVSRKARSTKFAKILAAAGTFVSFVLRDLRATFAPS